MLLSMMLFLLGVDFPICDAIQNQGSPDVLCVNDIYYVFWNDTRDYSDTNQVYSVYGTRVLSDGSILDPNGKEVYCDTAYGQPDAAYDGSNFLVVLREGKSG